MLSNYLSSRVVVQSGYKNISIISINDDAAAGEFLDLYLKSVQENFVYNFERKTKSEIKLNSEHLFWTCYTWNTVNTNWRMKYLFWYCLKASVRNSATPTLVQ